MNPGSYTGPAIRQPARRCKRLAEKRVSERESDIHVSTIVILYSLSTSLVLLCSLKTQDYVLLLSTFITEYDVLLLWLSQSLSPSLSQSLSLTPCAHRLNTAHFTDTPTFLLIIYHTLIHVHTQCHTIK